MTAGTGSGAGQRTSRWRIAGWSAAALVLLLPLAAMQVSDEVNWSVADFVFAAALLLAVGIPMELAVRKSGDAAYRAGAGVALGAAFLLIWINGAVGIIGSENNDANLMYVGVLAVGLIGTALARFEAPGMARALFATAFAQALIAVVALVAGWGATENGPREIIGINAFFIALFVGSALLFQKAARAGPCNGARHDPPAGKLKSASRVSRWSAICASLAVATGLGIGWLDLHTTEVAVTVLALLLGGLLLGLLQPNAAWRWAVLLALGLPTMAAVAQGLRLRTAEPIRLDPRVVLVAWAFALVGCYGGVLVRRGMRRLILRGPPEGEA